MAKKLTHWKTQFNYDYLGSYSLADDEDEDRAVYTDVVLTIKKIARADVKNERGTENLPVIYFKEKVAGENKPMILNKTNSEIIAKLYSPYLEKWIDKKIQLYVDEKIRAKGGGITSGLRIRDFIPKEKVKPILDPKSPKWEAAKKSVAEGMSIEALRKHFTITDENYSLLHKSK